MCVYGRLDGWVDGSTDVRAGGWMDHHKSS